MFGRKKAQSKIDKDQLELIENAQKRRKQKKRLYNHFVFFLFSTLFLVASNILFGAGENLKLFEKPLYLFIVFIWAFLLIYHFFNVFITHKFMGKTWEKHQLEKLTTKQQKRINKLKTNLVKEENLILESGDYKTNLPGQLPQKPKITIIAAAAENNAIGKDNTLIWHLSKDLKRFKTLTNGHHIIMGRKTFESFPKPLPNRTHVVITRQQDYKVPAGVITVNALEDAIQVCKNDPQPFIIGGGEIYKQALSLAHKIELTRVHERFEADAFFPEIDKTQWRETSNIFHKRDETHEHEFSFITYEKIFIP